jgi:hypothetical protein
MVLLRRLVRLKEELGVFESVHTRARTPAAASAGLPGVTAAEPGRSTSDGALCAGGDLLGTVRTAHIQQV